MGLVATYLRLVRTYPALARLLVGEFVSGIGDWLYLVAILVVVYAETSSPVLLGIIGARALYRFTPEHEPLMQLGPLYTLLDNKYYLDWLYFNGIVRPLRDNIAAAMYWTNDRVIDRAVYLAGSGTTRLGKATYALGDQKGIDGAVNGLGLSAMWSGAKVRLAQSGFGSAEFAPWQIGATL